jgi:hypothetical protein
MSVDLLLLETGPGGAGGNGELVADARGRLITPIVLAPRAGAKPDRAVFETAAAVEPRLFVTLRIGEEHHGWRNDGPVARMTLRLQDGGQIVAPSACAESGGATVDLVTRIVVNDATGGAPLTLITRHPWECRIGSDGSVTLRVQPASGQP